MKKNLKKIVVSALAVAVIAGSFATFSANRVQASAVSPSTLIATEQASAQHTINVNGTATIKVTPDIATISFGVQTQDVSSKKAQTDNATLMAAVTKALKAAGITDKDMQTSGYYINPQYSYGEKADQNKVTGYQVSNSVNVTVKDISKVGAIIDTAANAGANIAGGITFSLSNNDEAYNKALEQALTSAKGKATVLAKALDVKLGNPVSVTEGSAPQQQYPMYSSKSATYDMAAPQTPVSVGTVEVIAQVSVSYGY